MRVLRRVVGHKMLGVFIRGYFKIAQSNQASNYTTMYQDLTWIACMYQIVALFNGLGYMVISFRIALFK